MGGKVRKVLPPMLAKGIRIYAVESYQTLNS